MTGLAERDHPRSLVGGKEPRVKWPVAPEGRAIGKAEGRRLREFLDRQKETAPVVGTGA
jgi:hypothetical protein